MVRFALTKRVPIQAVIDLLKETYLSVCKEEFELPNTRMTDSRISVLTGLQRKEIKSLRTTVASEDTVKINAGPLSRLIARWRGVPEFQDSKGRPKQLKKSGIDPSFESLVEQISKDIHPRTVLDELVALDHVTVDGDLITLTTDAFVPREDKQALLNYLANNLGDHATAAVANVLCDNKHAPYFERAVHYNRLSSDSIRELDALSRQLQQQALEQINAKAISLQSKDSEKPNATGRFRCGSFVFHRNSKHQDITGLSL